MSDLGGNPHLEGIISDFEGLEHLFLFLSCIYLVADHIKQLSVVAGMEVAPVVMHYHSEVMHLMT